MSKSPRRRGHDFDQVRTSSTERAPSIAEQVDVFKFPADTFVTLRIISPVFMYSGYWVKTKTKSGESAKFYTPSPSYDPESQSFDSTIFDPFYGVYKDEHGVEREDRLVQVSTYGYCCAIIIKEEKDKPARRVRPTEHERKTGFKEKDSDSWTPVKVIRLSSTMMEQIKGISQTNVVTHPKTGESRAMSVSHPRHGILIRIKHSPKKSPASQYQILPGPKSPMNEERNKYLTWDLSDLERPEKEEDIRTSFDRWKKAVGYSSSGEDDGFDDDYDDDGFEDDDRPKKKSKAKPSKKRRKESEEDWDDDDVDNEEDADWDDDESSAWDDDEESEQKPKSRKGKKRKPVEDDWDEGEDDSKDDDEDDWEEEAPPKRKAKVKPKKRREEPEEEDWDEDEDGDDGWDGDEDGEDADWDDDEPEQKPKSRNKQRRKKR